MCDIYCPVKTTLVDDGVVRLELPISSPNLLKSSTSLELGYDAARMGLRTAVPRRSSKDKGRPMISVEAPCEVTYTSEPAKEERNVNSNEEVVCTANEDLIELQSRKSKINLTDLPEEVQQVILGCLVGDLGSISSKSSGTGVRNWHYALRHPRAKDHTNLALVTPSWTRLIQQRLYRHIRIEGTQQGLNDCYSWFLEHPHLQEHVRHVEFWVPVWERRPQSMIHMQSMATTDDLHQLDNMPPISNNYQLSSTSSSIEEMFLLIEAVFQQACILTIEGGTCKKPPRIPISRHEHESLPSLPNIKTLVLKGAWTMIREHKDYDHFCKALPNLKDWQCMFAAPKYSAYTVMNAVMPTITSQLTHLHLCMDGFYSKKWLNPEKVEDLRQNHHLCASLGILLTQLEALTFSGRACYSLFTSAMEACNQNLTTKPRLKTIDLALRNCCRDRKSKFGEGMGMYNLGFINAFEKLVTAATASLSFFTNLTSMRIRFVDLDSPMASLNPYFQIKDKVAYGLYSEHILHNLAVLPTPIYLAQEVVLVDNEHGFGFQARRLVGRRPDRIHVSQYEKIGHG